MADDGGGGPHPTPPQAPFDAAEACWPPLGPCPSAIGSQEAPRLQALGPNPAAVADGAFTPDGPAAGASDAPHFSGSASTQGRGPRSCSSRTEPRRKAPAFNPAAVGSPDRAAAAALGHSPAAIQAGGAHGRPTLDANAAAGSNGALTSNAAAVSPSAALASGSNPSPLGVQSFAQVLLRTLAPTAAPFPVRPPAHTDTGEPAIFFTQEEVNWSCRPLQLAVIARTPQGRPSFPEIRSHFVQRFKFQKEFVISSLDTRHLLIRFQDNEDFLQILLKESMLVQGRLFKFFRWSIDFCPDMDSPVVPLWVELPQLPANFFTESMIRSIAGSLGPVLKVDRNTLHMACTQYARVNVQMDVSKELPERLWIGCGSKGFWQPVIYPDPPHFCSVCRRLGHLPETCKKRPRSAQAHGGVDPAQAAPKAPPVDVNGPRPMERRKWRPVLPRDVTPNALGAQHNPLVSAGSAPGLAHQLLDRMPVKPPLPQMGADPVTAPTKGPPNMPSTETCTNVGAGMPPCMTPGSAQDSHGETVHEGLHMGTVKNTTYQVFDEMSHPGQQPEVPTVDSPSGSGYGTPLPLGTQDTTPLTVMAAPRKPKQPTTIAGTRAHQVFVDLPQSGQHTPTADTAALGEHSGQAAGKMLVELPSQMQRKPTGVIPPPIDSNTSGPNEGPLGGSLGNANSMASMVFDEILQQPHSSHQVTSCPQIEAEARTTKGDSFETARTSGECPHSEAPIQLEQEPAQLAPAPATFAAVFASSSLDSNTNSDGEYDTPTQLGARSNVKPDQLLDDPNQFARFLQGSPMEAMSTAHEAKCTGASPSPARLSFAEALRKKTRKSGPWPPPPDLPPPLAMRAAPPQPVPHAHNQHGGNVINLPVLYNIRSVPGLEPPEMDADRLLTLHHQFAGRPRTRSTTIYDRDSDEEHEKLSE